MENRTTNILLVGVGGQGIILASEVMADVFMEAGFDVKKSEVHGMSQRGGSVSTHVRFGPKNADKKNKRVPPSSPVESQRIIAG